MNSSPSRLSSAHSTLILDASVVINLLGTGDPALLLTNLKRQAFVDEVVLNEVQRNPAGDRRTGELLQSLESSGLLNVVRMSDDAYQRFVELTGAKPPDDLDDGEAATLAQAVSSRCGAVIDERKANRIATAMFPHVPILSTMDLLTAPEVVARIGEDQVSELIYRALRNARMRVPPTFRGWVVGRLGVARLAHCPSIGRTQFTGTEFLAASKKRLPEFLASEKRRPTEEVGE